MEKIIKIIMERDGISYEDARALVKETMDEIACRPMESDEIIISYLMLEPDYLMDLIGY